jgi:hypothetical protein
MPLPPAVQKHLDQGKAHARVELGANWRIWNPVDVARWMLKCPSAGFRERSSLAGNELRPHRHALDRRNRREAQSS